MGDKPKMHSSFGNKTTLLMKETCDGEIRLAPSSVIPLPDAASLISAMASRAGSAKVSKREAKSKREQEKQRAYRKNKLFRRIEADIKERDRKRIPGRPEEYVDRDRLISVIMTGQEDIRSQMLKQRTYLTHKGGIMNGGGIFHTLIATEDYGSRVLVEQALHEMKRGANDVALSYIEKALALSPDDLNCLLYKASCYVKIQKYKEAIGDADRALYLYINASKAQKSKAYAIKGASHYHMGEFEKSLMHYYRALLRCANSADEEDIRMGIRRSIEAVDNAIGPGSADHFLTMPQMLNQIPDTIFGLPWHDLMHMRDKDVHSMIKKNSLRKLSTKLNPTQENTKRQSPLDRHKRRLLGKLCQDLDYLESLTERMDLGSKSKKGDETEELIQDEGNTDVEPFEESENFLNPAVVRNVQREASDAVAFLKTRQVFWSQYKPLYSKS